MPAPKSPTRYPAEYRALFERAQAGETVVIDSSHPMSLRGRLYGYARALRAEGLSELADAVQISLRGPQVIVQSRSHSQETKEIASSLAQLGGDTPESMLERLVK